MPRRVPAPSDDVTVYLILNDYKTGLAYVETASAEADRETIICNFLSGQYSNALCVVADFLSSVRWCEWGLIGRSKLGWPRTLLFDHFSVGSSRRQTFVFPGDFEGCGLRDRVVKLRRQ
jgi:hypothetical protein